MCRSLLIECRKGPVPLADMSQLYTYIHITYIYIYVDRYILAEVMESRHFRTLWRIMIRHKVSLPIVLLKQNNKQNTCPTQTMGKEQHKQKPTSGGKSFGLDMSNNVKQQLFFLLRCRRATG